MMRSTLDGVHDERKKTYYASS